MLLILDQLRVLNNVLGSIFALVAIAVVAFAFYLVRNVKIIEEGTCMVRVSLFRAGVGAMCGACLAVAHSLLRTRPSTNAVQTRGPVAPHRSWSGWASSTAS